MDQSGERSKVMGLGGSEEEETGREKFLLKFFSTAFENEAHCVVYESLSIF